MAVDIGDRTIGPGHACLVVAEIGVNHNGDPKTAHRMVEEAAHCGADAVKFQTYATDKLVSKAAPLAGYQRRSGAASQHEMLSRLELSPEVHRDLIAQCRERGVLFLSSAFDEDSADLLASMDVPAFKVPSGELTNVGLVSRIASYGKPMLVSTGMATLDEVRDCVETCRASGNADLILLHCVSSYPAPIEEANLLAINTLMREFGTPVGYSDHVDGPDAAIAAVALGACVIEKHFTFDRTAEGPDHAASMEPEGFEAMIASIRRVEAALGDGVKVPKASERETREVARKSLVAAIEIEKGTTITEDMIAVRRPGTGMPPSARMDLAGRRAHANIKAGTILTPELFE